MPPRRAAVVPGFTQGLNRKRRLNRQIGIGHSVCVARENNVLAGRELAVHRTITIHGGAVGHHDVVRDEPGVSRRLIPCAVIAVPGGAERAKVMGGKIHRLRRLRGFVQRPIACGVEARDRVGVRLGADRDSAGQQQQPGDSRGEGFGLHGFLMFGWRERIRGECECLRENVT